MEAYGLARMHQSDHLHPLPAQQTAGQGCLRCAEVRSHRAEMEAARQQALHSLGHERLFLVKQLSMRPVLTR